MKKKVLFYLLAMITVIALGAMGIGNKDMVDTVEADAVQEVMATM